MVKETQKIPEWFNGNIGDVSEEIENPFSGESIELNPLEVAMYDLTIGANMMAEKLDYKFLQTFKEEDMNDDAQYFWDLVRKGNSWFRENNPKAYMVLLD